jgi:hypothetical protein
MQDVNNYTTANHTFFLKYNEYAGDMLDASTNAYWGVSNTGGSNLRGDKRLDGYREGVRSWHHLKLAGILDGNYDGVVGVDSEVPGVTVGYSGYASDAGFNIFTLGDNSNQWGYGSADIYDLSGPTIFAFGKIETGSSQLLNNAVLTPKDAYQIDLKYDDGLPNRGKVLADHGVDVGNNNQCVDYAKWANGYNASGDDGRAYKLSNTEPKCRMMFIFR